MIQRWAWANFPEKIDEKEREKKKKKNTERKRENNLPLNAIPLAATTQVWMTVFSCLVNGLLNSPDFARTFVHVFTKKNPSNPAETFSDGIIPVVRFSFITMNVNATDSTALTTTARTVSCPVHGGTAFPSNSFSTETASASSSSAVSDPASSSSL